MYQPKGSFFPKKSLFKAALWCPTRDYGIRKCFVVQKKKKNYCRLITLSGFIASRLPQRQLACNWEINQPHQTCFFMGSHKC